MVLPQNSSGLTSLRVLAALLEADLIRVERPHSRLRVVSCHGSFASGVSASPRVSAASTGGDLMPASQHFLAVKLRMNHSRVSRAARGLT
jgi:glucose/arabinose dehydrogenase